MDHQRRADLMLLLFTYWHPVHRSLKRVLRPL